MNNAEEMAMRSCFYAATKSPDPSTQNAAMVINVAGPVPIGPKVNDFPALVTSTPTRWEKPAKYNYVEHAERAVIYKAARDGVSLQGATMVAVWAACTDCARAIIAAGIVRLVRHTASESPTWDESIAIGDHMMLEAGIVIYDDDTVYGDLPEIRRSGQLVSP
jgi:dCMP deaminase